MNQEIPKASESNRNSWEALFMVFVSSDQLKKTRCCKIITRDYLRDIFICK